jgi:hypothetical protein
MDRTITPQDYQDMKGRIDNEIVLVKYRLTELPQEISPFKVYIQKEVTWLHFCRKTRFEEWESYNQYFHRIHTIHPQCQ